MGVSNKNKKKGACHRDPSRLMKQLNKRIGNCSIKRFLFIWLFLLLASACHGVSCLYGQHNKVETGIVPIYQQTFLAPIIPDLNFFLLGKGAIGYGKYTDKFSGEERSWTCGDLRANWVCGNPACSKPHYSPIKCKRKACPNCYGGWIAKARDKIAARLLSIEARKRHGGKRLAHIVVSPADQNPPRTKVELNKLIRGAYEYIKRKGALGGVAIFHPFRALPIAKELSRKQNMKVWAWIRKQPHPEQYYRYSPHLHLIAYIGHLEPPEKGETWVYKTKVDSRGRVINLLQPSKTKNKEENIKGLGYYLLTHAVTIKNNEGGFESVRWFGSCSRVKFKSTEEEEEALKSKEEPPKCVLCGSPLIPFWEWIKTYYVDVDAGGMPPPPYMDEIERALAGEPPPDNAKDFLIERDKW